MMNNELRPYENYKSIDLPWLCSIPTHWSISRNKNVMFQAKSLVGSNHSNYKLLSLTLNGVIARDMVNPKGKFPKEFDTYQIVNQKDLVFCLFDIDETPRTVGISPFEGMITGAYTVFNVKDANERYLYYYYLALDNNKMLKPLYTGLRKVISADTFLRTKLPVPPRTEQDQIVKYLDHQLAKINRFIKTKRKLITVLKEQKQVIINEAVTKGLDPNVKMKASGIDWLGDVPDHWELIRLKYLARKFGSGVTPKGGAAVYSQEGIPFLRSQNVYNEGLRLENVSYISKEINDKMVSSQVRPDDILLNITGASIGRVCKVPSDFDGANINQHICIIRLMKKKVDPQFVAYFLSSSSIQKQIVMLQNGASREGLPLKITKNFIIPLPPIEEQLRIVEVIDERTEKLTSSILKIEREIQLLSEYKDSLISDVVAGKVDVRNIVIDEFDEEISEDIEIDEESIEEESFEDEDGDD